MAERWAKTGTTEKRGVRYVVALPEELSRWLAKESGVEVPVKASRAIRDG
jgi:hypothetical protein